ncbi:M48 family metalloprotease [Sphaerisporangium melleum]|nr:M48 family metalloprotease [Sphaerisporangium melleum]
MTGRSPEDRFDTMSRHVLETCAPHVSIGMGVYTIAMIAAVLVLALAIYWWLPRRLVRRRRLTALPPPQTLPDVHREIQELQRLTGVGDVGFLLDPLDRRVTGLAFGRVGRRRVVLSHGLVRTATTDPERFRAVMLHELAHIRNGDIDPTYLTIAVWRAWLILVLAPAFLNVIINQMGGVFWRLVVTALLVRMVRDATLRSREHYADARAAQWSTTELLHRALGDGGRPLPRRFARRWGWGWGTHPESASRRSALADPGWVTSIGFGDGLALGTTTVYSLSSLTLIAGWLLADPPGTAVHLLPFTALLSCALTFGIFRVVLAARLTGRRVNLDRLGIGLGTGFVLGTFITPRFGLLPSDVPISGAEGMPSMPAYLWLAWAGLMVAGGVLSVRWITELLATWLPYAASRRSPLRMVLGCTVVTTAVLTIWLAFGVGLPSLANMAAHMIFPDAPQELVFLGVLIIAPVLEPLSTMTLVVLLWAAPLAATMKWVRAGPARAWVSLPPPPDGTRLSAPPAAPARAVSAALIAVSYVAVRSLIAYPLILLGAVLLQPPRAFAGFLALSGGFAGIGAQILAVVLALTLTRSLRLPHAMLAATLAYLPATVAATLALSLASCATTCQSPLAQMRITVSRLFYLPGLALSLLVAALLIVAVPRWRRPGGDRPAPRPARSWRRQGHYR